MFEAPLQHFVHLDLSFIHLERGGAVRFTGRLKETNQLTQGLQVILDFNIYSIFFLSLFGFLTENK